MINGKIVIIPMDQLIRMRENANAMDDPTFADLVAKIDKRGFDQPLKVWWNDIIKKYEIVKGNHRYEASKILKATELPCIIGEYESRDEAIADSMSDNITTGSIDPEIFTQNYSRLVAQYGDEKVEEMLMIKNKKSLDGLIKQAREHLPPDMKKAFDEAKNDIKNIDDLAEILQKLFAEFGHTVPYNFMFFTFGGATHITVTMDKRLKEQVDKIAEICYRDKLNMTIEFQKALDLYMTEHKISLIPETQG